MVSGQYNFIKEILGKFRKEGVKDKDGFDPFVIFSDQNTKCFVQYIYENNCFMLNFPSKSSLIKEGSYRLVKELLEHLSFTKCLINNNSVSLNEKEYQFYEEYGIYAQCGNDVDFVADLTETIFRDILKVKNDYKIIAKVYLGRSLSEDGEYQNSENNGWIKNKDSIFSSSYYLCSNCNKKLYENDDKYSYRGKVVCESCLNKITGKIGLSIKLEDTEYENVKYNEEEFIEFRKQIIVAGKKAEDKGLSFSIGRWFIGNYLKNNKIPEKPLKMLLDFEMDTFPSFVETANGEKVQITNEILINQLNKSLQEDLNSLIEKIKKKKKWDIVVNFVKQNKSGNIIVGSEQERKKLLELLKRYGVELKEMSLLILLAHIQQEEENERFKKIIKDKIANKSVNECIYVFLYVFGEKYESHLSLLVDILDEFNLLKEVIFIKPLIEEVKKEIEMKTFEDKLKNPATKRQMADFSSMSGHQFEYFLGDLFKKLGYKVINTKLSGDQGADIIIEKFKEKTAVQAKNYTHPVSNSAIQEVVAAKKHYDCQKAMVVTTSSYTKSAISLAKSNNVELWDKKRLLKEIEKNF